MLVAEHLSSPPDDFLSDKADDAAYYRAFQESGIPGFRFGYFAFHRDGRRVSVVPYFITHFALDTMVPQGVLKRLLAPLKLRIACVGHPYADGAIDGECSTEVLHETARLLREQSALVVFKGFGPDLPLRNFVVARGLPNAVLDVQPDYWERLSHSRRKALKKKVRQAEPLRVEERLEISPDEAAQLHRLYLNVHDRAVSKFEQVTAEYFLRMAPISRYVLFFEEDRLIGFVQLSRKKPRMVVRYGGLDYDRSQHYGLYFMLAIKALDIAIREGYELMDLGASSYEFKRMLGCRFDETWIYYSHSNPLVHWVLGKLKVVLEPSEEELK